MSGAIGGVIDFNNLKISDNGMAYIVIDEDVLNKYEVDSATAGKMINNFNYISY